MDGCAFSATAVIGYDGGVLRLRRCVRQGRLIQSEGRVEGGAPTKVVPVFGPAAMAPVGAIPLLRGVAKLTRPSPSPRLVEVSGRKPRFGELA